MRVRAIGVAGGSGSGKTTVARALVESLPAGSAVLLEHDAYYRDQSHLPLEERAKINYDHPSALDNALFLEHIATLRNGGVVEKPVYDYAHHTRASHTVRIEAAPVLIVEGILILCEPAIRDALDIKLFVDTDSDIRIMRRIRRDMEQRGRTFAQIRAQYYESVRPMHVAFVEPSKRFADLIVPEGGHNQVALDLILHHLERHVLGEGFTPLPDGRVRASVPD